MANSVWDWSATAASNNATPPYGMPENSLPSTVDDTMRQIMAANSEAVHSAIAGGTADALTVTMTNVPAALTDGMEIPVRAAAANATTTPTLNLNSLGAKTITKLGGSALAAGDIAGNLAEYTFRYNLANTRWEILNPSKYAASSLAAGNLSIAINETSATIASAATVNIGAAAANYIFISGTTTITAFDTIQSGVERELEFQGALTLTHNATSLILPGSKNIVTVAGDTAIFLSEGSGNWRCISYQPSSASLLRDVVGAVRNLKVVQASATTATVTADEIVCKTVLGGIPRIISSLSVTLNIATTGANGMDTGSATLNADLSLYAIAGPGKTDAVLAVLGTTSNGSIYSGINMPAGYTASALIGSYLMNGSAQFNDFVQIDRTVEVAAVQVLTNGVAVSPTAVSLSTAVPANTRYVEGYSQTSTTNAATIAADANNIGAKLNQNTGSANTGMFDMYLKTTQQIFYSVSAGNVSIFVSGYSF